MPKKKPLKGKPVVNEEVEGLDVTVNKFGQIESHFDMKKIIEFLNRNVDDKKLRDREDIDHDGEFLKDEKEKPDSDETADKGTDR